VTVWVSTGPCTGGSPVTVPNVVGKTESAAGSDITGAGLTLGTTTRQCSPRCLGQVISQSPWEGVRSVPALRSA